MDNNSRRGGAESGSVATNMVWSVVERVTSQLLSTLISILLARILLPEDYASVALVTVFVNLAGTVVSSSFSSALIYDKEQSVEHYSTALYAVLIFTGALYAILFAVAPLISSYYEDPAVLSITRVMSLLFVLQGVYSILFAYVSKNMLFRKTNAANMVGALTGAVIAIALALNGHGVWALVCLPMVECAVSSTILWVRIKFRLSWTFDWPYVKFMVKYCTKFVVVDLLNSLYSSINSLTIAKKYSKADLSYYTKAYNLPQMLLGSVNTAISKVLFPVFSKSNGDIEEVRDKLRMGIKLSCYVLMPLMAGLMMVSDAAVRFLFTEKWIGMVPYLQIMCVLWAFQPVQICAIQAFKAIGKGDEYLRLEIYKKGISLAILFTLLYLVNDPIAVAWAAVGGQIVSCLINVPFLKKLLHYSVRHQLMDLLEPIVLCAVMGVAVYWAGTLVALPIACLMIQVFVGISVYILISAVTKNKNFYSLLRMLKDMLARRGKTEEN